MCRIQGINNDSIAQTLGDANRSGASTTPARLITDDAPAAVADPAIDWFVRAA